MLTSGGEAGACCAARSAALEVSFFLFVFVVFAGRGDFIFKVVYGAAGFGHEAAHVSGHLGEGSGAEDHQKDEADYYDLLGADAEHGTEYNPGGDSLQTAATLGRGQRIYSAHVCLRQQSFMISWGAARTIAVTLASRTERGPAGDFDYAGAVRTTLDPLSRFTGIELPQGLPDGRQLRIADRAEWIDFNIEGFGHLMEPLVQRAAAGAGDLTWAIGGVTLTAQVGLLLGFLSSRVLGQYDTGPLLTPGRDGEPGKVFFLDGNITSAAGRLGVPVDGLRLWIVLHEMTHALQVEGYPGLRRHLGELLESLISPLADRLGVRETLRRLSTNLRTGGRSVELLMSRSQRDSFDRMQATMSVIEGYSDYVMHHVGKGLVPHYEHLKERMSRSRSHRPPFETAVFRLTGLDVKLEQYKLGEAFAAAVVTRQGMEGLNRIWENPENLPTLAEVRDPGLWMSRLGT